MKTFLVYLLAYCVGGATALALIGLGLWLLS